MKALVPASCNQLVLSGMLINVLFMLLYVLTCAPHWHADCAMKRAELHTQQ
jgi:hypothetical protein